MPSKFFDWLSTLQPRQLLGLASVAALVYGALTTIRGEQAERTMPTTDMPTVEVPMKTVVVASKNIEPKTMLNSKVLELKEMPGNSIPDGALTSIEQAANLPARVHIFKGDVITSNKIYRNSEQAGFVGSIPPDCRAISIGISDVTSVSGFINPGDHVDVMMVCERGDEIHSELILQNVLLLAMGKRAVQTEKGILEGAAEGFAAGLSSGVAGAANAAGGAEKSSSTATLALHSDEILRIAAAARKGTLYLVMRPFRPDEEIVGDVSYSMSAVPDDHRSMFDGEGIYPSLDLTASTQSAQPPTPAFQPPPSPVVNKPAPSFNPPNANNPPADQGIEIIQGDKVTKK